MIPGWHIAVGFSTMLRLTAWAGMTKENVLFVYN